MSEQAWYYVVLIALFAALGWAIYEMAMVIVERLNYNL